MKKIKTFLLVTLLFCFLTMFSACSTTRLMIMQNDNGTVDELVYVTIDRDEVSALGEDYGSIKQSAESIARSTATRLAVEYNSSHMQSEIATEIPVQLIEVVWYEENSFVVGLRFLNSAVYNQFYGITQTSNSAMEKEKHFLYTKYYQTGYTLYATSKNLATSIYEQMYYEYPNLTKANNKLLYTYVTDSRREHSDADYVTYTSGKYYHTWEIDKSNINQKITIYYILLNRANLILIGLGVSLLVCGACVCAALLKNFNKVKTVEDGIDK